MNDGGKKKKGRVSGAVPFQVEVPPSVLASRWGDWRTWLNIFFLFLVLEIAVYSIEQAHWITPQPLLTLVLFLSVAVVRLLTVTRLPGWTVHVLAVIAGVLVTIWQGMMILPDASGPGRLFTVINSWLRGASGLQTGEEKVVFGLLLALLTWIVGYLSTWFVLRRNNAWVAVSLGIAVILVNLSNLTEKNYIFFTLFLLAAVLLIIQTRIVRQYSLSGYGTGYSGKSLFYLIVSLLCITVVAVSISWVTPQMRFPALQNAIAAGLPWKSGIQESSFNILNAVPSKKSFSTAAGLQDMTFGEYWHTSDEIKFTVISPQPAYWQVNVYDTYTSGSWKSSPAVEELVEKETGWEETGEKTGRERMKYEVITGINTDALLLAGDFVSSEMPVLVRYGIEEEVTAVRAPRVLSSGESYTIRSYVSDATAGDLYAAGEDYPEAIESVYLQLPSDFPGDIRLLSENITVEAKTPYEMVTVIDDYLSTFPYSHEVDALPEGADAVADFLFTQKRGFCLHFASAMAVMLRSVGVPARLAVGYLPGDPGEEKGEYILRDKHYHAWTQIYFPGYGWIDFEPTPSEPGSQVSIESPLISTPDIRELPAWNIWNYPIGAGPVIQGEIPETTPEARSPISGRLSYADELGRALIIIFGIVLAFGLAFGLSRLARPLYSGWLWEIDREHLASSAYANLCRLAAMFRIIPEPQQTPLEFSSKLAAVIPERSKELEFLVRSYLAKRFGPAKGRPDLYEEAEILKARILVYNAILQRTGKMQKFLASREPY